MASSNITQLTPLAEDANLRIVYPNVDLKDFKIVKNQEAQLMILTQLKIFNFLSKLIFKIDLKKGQYCPVVISMCVKLIAEALEVIPYTLTKNAELNLIDVTTELSQISKILGMKKNNILNDITTEQVVQHILVIRSALTLATQCIGMILKNDDLVILVL